MSAPRDVAFGVSIPQLDQNLPADLCKIVLNFAEIPRFSNTHVDTFECGAAEIWKVEMDKRNRIFVQFKNRTINIWEWWDGQSPRQMKTFFEHIEGFCIHDNGIFILKNSILYVYDFDFNMTTSFRVPYMCGSRIFKMYCSLDWLVLITDPSDYVFEFIWVFSLKDTFSQTKSGSFLILQYADKFSGGAYEVYIVNHSELWFLSVDTSGCDIGGLNIITHESIHSDEIYINKIYGHDHIFDICFKSSKLFCICSNDERDGYDMVVLDYPCRRGGKSYMIQNAAPYMFSKFAMSDSGFAIFTVGSSIEIKK